MAFGNKSNTPSYSITLPMVVTPQQADFLANEFQRGNNVYNAMIAGTIKQWHQLRKAKQFKAICRDLKSCKANDLEKRKKFLDEKNCMLKAYGFSEDAFHRAVKAHAKHFGVHSAIAQVIATNAWKAWSDFFFGKGKEVHFNRIEDFCSLSGKNNDWLPASVGF